MARSEQTLVSGPSLTYSLQILQHVEGLPGATLEYGPGSEVSDERGSHRRSELYIIDERGCPVVSHESPLILIIVMLIMD